MQFIKTFQDKLFAWLEYNFGQTKLYRYVNSLDVHTKEVMTKSIASIIVKGVGMLFVMLVSIYIGRTLGAEGKGIIDLANTVASILLVISTFGMGQVVIKQTSIARSTEDWQTVRSVMYTSTIITVIIAVIIFVASILSIDFWVYDVFKEPLLRTPLIISILIVIPQTISRVYAAGLTGFRKIWQSSLVDNTLSFGVMLLIFTVMWIIDYHADVVTIAVVYAIGRVCVTIFTCIYWKKVFCHRPKSIWNAKPMLKTAFPLLLVGATSIIASKSDALMLGWLKNTQEVGLYSTAAAMSSVVLVVLTVANSTLAPKIAASYAEGDLRSLEPTIRKVTRTLALISFSCFVLFVFFGKFFLSIWGAEFSQAYWVLVILSFGQFVNISTGCAGMILQMTGYEKIEARVAIVALVANLILNYLLVSQYGMVGAAITTAFTVSASMLTRFYFVKKKLKLSMLG